jgi:hypothetical protein
VHWPGQADSSELLCGDSSGDGGLGNELNLFNSQSGLFPYFVEGDSHER